VLLQCNAIGGSRPLCAIAMPTRSRHNHPTTTQSPKMQGQGRVTESRGIGFGRTVDARNAPAVETTQSEGAAVVLVTLCEVDSMHRGFGGGGVYIRPQCHSGTVSRVDFDEALLYRSHEKWGSSKRERERARARVGCGDGRSER
jgi:hypothetical protein